MKLKNFVLFFIAICIQLSVAQAQIHQPKFSTAGFYALEETGRKVYSMNLAWRFFKGKNENAYRTDFNDSSWQVVSIPHSVEYLPAEASGGINYQGEAWYRKHFVADASLKGKKIFLHFEAIMGKSKVYVNGNLVKTYFGGYLPVIVDVSDLLKFGEQNLIAVCADNSNDPDYPPGKKQETLDFTYSGGIYRDCWLIAHNNIFITDANYEKETAGGGLFIAYKNVSDKKAEIILKTHIRNENNQNFTGKIIYTLKDTSGKKIASQSQFVQINNKNAVSFQSAVTLANPHLWSPDDPFLYNFEIKISDKKGNIVDGYSRRVGVRSIEFKGKAGFWLNGKPYGKPVIGVNRHQDFAIIGNALPNGLHWRDAVKLKSAGIDVIRNAHYPQDPAFMDACDELGLFVIVNTPGWQFWNEKPIFEQRVYEDIRNMVRRDRNHAAVWMWEPVLNETYYPEHFAKRVKEIVEEEISLPLLPYSLRCRSKRRFYFSNIIYTP